MDRARNGETTQGLNIGRRDALASLGLGAAALAAAGLAVPARAQQETSPIRRVPAPTTPESQGWDPRSNQYVLPPLPYKYEDLEPHIDAETMRLHHDKHHKGYVDGVNRALKMLAEIRAGSRDKSEVKHWSRELAFHGSGHLLHVLFWNCMGPNAGGEAQGRVGQAIGQQFGSFKGFADHFQAAANAVEGSGWGILAFEPTSRQLLIMQAEKHQNLTAWGVQPLVVLDVWEHAYYLKYKNVRSDYVAAFMNVINWDAVNTHYEAMLESSSA